MKQGMSLDQLAAELERQHEVKLDFRADTRDMKVEVVGDEPMLTIRGHEPMKLKDRAHGQIAGALGVPKKYWDRMVTQAPDLVAINANHWLTNQPDTQLVRTLDGNVRAFLGSAYRIVDHLSIIGHLLPHLRDFDPDVKYESMGLTDDNLYIKAITPRLTDDVKVGDTVQGGVVIRNSETGAGSISVAPLILRLVCSNGMIRDEGAYRRRHAGANIKVGEGDIRYAADTIAADDAALALKVRDQIKHIVSTENFGQIVGLLRHSTTVPVVGDPVRVVERLAKAESMPEFTRNGIMSAFLGERDMTRFGLAQAVTATARDVADYEHATDLERLGWQIAAGAQADLGWMNAAD